MAKPATVAKAATVTVIYKDKGSLPIPAKGIGEASRLLREAGKAVEHLRGEGFAALVLTCSDGSKIVYMFGPVQARKALLDDPKACSAWYATAAAFSGRRGATRDSLADFI